MQQAIQKAHEWSQNLHSEDVAIYLDELSGNNITFAEDASMRSVTTNQYKIMLPTYVNIDEEIARLKLEQNEILTDYIFVVNELIYGNRNDVVMNERYELLAKQLTRIQQELLNFQQYLKLDPESRNIMIHPPQLTRIAQKRHARQKGRVHKGGAAVPQTQPESHSLPSANIQDSVKSKVKTLLKLNYTGKN
jgi:hypothetical protein